MFVIAFQEKKKGRERKNKGSVRQYIYDSSEDKDKGSTDEEEEELVR